MAFAGRNLIRNGGSKESDWYDTDDVYVAYVDNGYCLYNQRYPNVGIAIRVAQ
jgi:hypothetical protein